MCVGLYGNVLLVIGSMLQGGENYGKSTYNCTLNSYLKAAALMLKIKNILGKFEQFIFRKASHLSKRDQAIVGCLAVGTVSLILTNPREEAYFKYASNHLHRRIEKQCGRINENLEFTPPFFRSPARDACKSLIGGSGFLIKPVAGAVFNFTTQEPVNLGVCRVYTTEIPMIKKFRTIGIAGQFIPVP